jgi:serine/threonine protein kinase
LAILNHQNISPLLGISSDFDRPDRPCLVFPYYPHGEISGYLTKHPSVDKFPLIAQITNALLYLHTHNIVHGDIKASNILINENLEATIIDFGLARILQESGFTTATSKGTWRFWAPEIMNDEHGIQRVTTATDVYAFAMTVIQIFTGHLPFSHIKSDAKVVLTVITGGRPQRGHCPQITDDIWGILETCWDVDPTRRPSMARLSEFFNLKSTLPTASSLAA